MTELERIKRHVDGFGVGCAVVRDHVAIAISWKSQGVDGRERRMETTCRAASFREACDILGCPYSESDGQDRSDSED